MIFPNLPPFGGICFLISWFPMGYLNPFPSVGTYIVDPPVTRPRSWRWRWKRKIRNWRRWKSEYPPPRKLTAGTWKWWFLIGISSSRGSFSGSMLVFRGVSRYPGIPWYPMVSHGIPWYPMVSWKTKTSTYPVWMVLKSPRPSTGWMFLKTLVDFFHQQYPPTQRQLGRWVSLCPRWDILVLLEANWMDVAAWENSWAILSKV